MVGSEGGEKFLPAFFLPVVKMGDEFTSGELPLHLTLIPPIQQPYQKRFGNLMRSRLNPREPFHVKAGAEGFFGENNDIRCRLIERARDLPLMGLHYLVAKALEELEYTKDFSDFNPHISIGSSDEVRAGDFFYVAGLSVVERYPDGWRVVDKIGLKGEG